ncbi:MAG: hypothetical protein DHS20C01_38420 [marine bacterium B5-7]|nr:MAG: hypothetical protein DHS20C01_38420 [marine bacterium B5-7]
MGNRFGTRPVLRTPSIKTVRNSSTRHWAPALNTLPSSQPKPTRRKTAAPAPPVEVNILFTLSNNPQGPKPQTRQAPPDRDL